jgi:hypothetical protein
VWCNRKHTVFGQVIEGFEVVKAIESVGARSGATSVDVIIEKCGEVTASCAVTPGVLRAPRRTAQPRSPSVTVPQFAHFAARASHAVSGSTLSVPAMRRVAPKAVPRMPATYITSTPSRCCPTSRDRTCGHHATLSRGALTPPPWFNRDSGGLQVHAAGTCIHIHGGRIMRRLCAHLARYVECGPNGDGGCVTTFTCESSTRRPSFSGA